MSDRHVPDAELERYVQGELSPGAGAAVERHVTACGACGARLARAARFEVAMHEVALAAGSGAVTSSSPVGVIPPRALRAASAGLLGAFGMAVAAAALMALPARTSRAGTQDPTVTTGTSTAGERPAAMVCADAPDGAPSCGIRLADASQ